MLPALDNLLCIALTQRATHPERNTLKTEGAVIAVSGGTSGLGAATCRYLLEHGARGVIALGTNEESGKQLQANLGK